ncbi:MAG TPA: RNA-directed DNA polymerase [Saprospiraceae bacterium]|nr:RNA-directed DNA polymerase [Saprospiraceae bacterium]HNM26103.1 RNA-directed DNA polymerase [Saprospiraceae bacterium]
MKRTDQLIERIADPDNLRLACWKAAKGKRHSPPVLLYGRHLDDNLWRLRQQILSGKVETGNYRYFNIREPKERRICAPAFSEQVLHHALMNVCDPYFERVQIHDSYASRRGRGIHAALQRAEVCTCRHDWFLKMDVRKFFDSIHHDVLKAQLAGLFKNEHLLAIFGQIIDSFSASEKRGVPIGNLCSQYFANHYLSGLDHFIKERLRIKAYVRYMDDLVLWHDDKRALISARQAVEEFVADRLLCDMKPVLCNKTPRGLPFLGYLIYPYHTRLLGASQRRFIRKIGIINANYETGRWSQAKCSRHAATLIAFTQHADALAFRKKVINT